MSIISSPLVQVQLFRPRYHWHQRRTLYLKRPYACDDQKLLPELEPVSSS